MDNYTVKQHYIPQVYLRGFSPEYTSGKEGNIDNSKYTVYCYDLSQKSQSDAIPIKSICYKKNLYEVTGDDGNIILPNYIENVFGRLEIMFSEYRRKLEAKAFLEENYRTKVFLTREEKLFWITYITLQIMRLPQVLKEAEKACNEVYGSKVSSLQAKNISRRFCTPFFTELKEDSPEARIFDMLFQPMTDMSFCVVADNSGKLLTSDKTVYMYSTGFPCDEYDKVIFPISSCLCLILIGGEEKKEYNRKNCLIPNDPEINAMIISAITDSAFAKLYSNHRLSKGEKDLINSIR